MTSQEPIHCMKVRNPYDADPRLHSRLAKELGQMHRVNKTRMACLWAKEETDVPGEEGVCQETEVN